MIPLACLLSCGGGGGDGGGGDGGGGGSNNNLGIIAVVLSFPTGQAPPGFIGAGNNSGAVVQVVRQDGVTPVTDAEVTINGITLPYVAANQDYEGELTVNPGAEVSLRVQAGSRTYTAARNQFTSYPTIVVPEADDVWTPLVSNVVSWSATPPSSTSQYALGIFDTTGQIEWPMDGFLAINQASTSHTIPANQLTDGERLVLLGLVDTFDISGTLQGSGLLLGGFNYTPITVDTASQTTLLSMELSPFPVTVGVNASLQLTATGHYSDGSTQDLTSQAIWSTGNSPFLAVNSSGLITGLDGGIATVDAEFGGRNAFSAVRIFEPTPTPALPLQDSSTYQIDYAHSGAGTVGGSGLTLPPSAQWRTQLNGVVSYPVVENGRVYVTTNVNSSGDSYGTSLYALDLATGNIAWGPVSVPGTYGFSGHAISHGKIFVINYDGILRRFDAVTGAFEWSTQMPGQNGFSAPPMAVGGIVYISGSGSGGTVYAIDEVTGDMLWRSQVVNGDKSSPTFSGDGIHVSYPCQVYKFDPYSGVSLWHYDGGCSGGGGKTSVYANGELFVRGNHTAPENPIFNADTGTIVGSFNAQPAPAFNETTGFFLDTGTLRAIDQATRNTLWPFAADGLVTAPIVIDDVVFIGSSSGTIYALDAASGAELWSGTAGTSIEGPDEQNVISPLVGLGVGSGHLLVPAGNEISGFRLVP